MTRQPANRQHNTVPTTQPPAQSQAPATPPGNNFATPGLDPKKVGLLPTKELLHRYRAAIQQVIPPKCGLDAEHLIANVLSYMMHEERKTLMLCKPRSILEAVMAAAKLGLDFVGDQAYLIPRTRNDRDGNFLYFYASLIPGYKGFITVAARNGFLITAQAVRHGDLFEADLGGLKVKHVPSIDSGRTDLIGSYSVARRASDMAVVHVEWMSKSDIDAVKGKSDAWVNHYEEMARSRPVRRMFKYLPASMNNREMFLVAEITNRADMDQEITDLVSIEGDPQVED